MAVSAKIPRMVFRHVLYMAVFALFAVGVQPSAGQAADEPAKGSNFLTGKLLVASPKMADPRFAETVIFMVNHDAKGAFGLIVNRSYGKGPMQSFLKGFGIEAEQAGGDIRIHYGGPVEPERGFILHTDDFKDPTTVDIDGGYSLTVKLDVLRAIAKGGGPRRSFFAFGYAGWAPGQLEAELARQDWTTAPASENLVFSDQLEAIWQKARDAGGISL